jgi:2-keto-4-pentenoate hydratase
MAMIAVSARADAFVRAWVTGSRLMTLPQPPKDAQELFQTQKAIAEHPLVASKLGGVAGYKLGGAYAIPGEPCLWAPLFKRFIVETPGTDLSAAAIGLCAIEPEIAVIMGADLKAREDGMPHSESDVWRAVDRVALAFEVCGKRLSPEACVDAPKIGTLADTLSSGGVVIGTSWPAASELVTPEAVRSVAVDLMVNDVKVAEGSSSLCPEGGPAQALTYFANHLNTFGMSLKAGDLVATGQSCNTKTLKAGDVARANFAGLGTVEWVVPP